MMTIRIPRVCFCKTARGLLALALMAFCLDARGVVYLKADAPEGGDGTSWETAFQSADDAIAATTSDNPVIYAAAGVYVVDGEKKLPDGFAFYGGFAGLSGTETTADREPASRQTILTCDRDRDDC